MFFIYRNQLFFSYTSKAPTQWLDSPDHLRERNQTSEQPAMTYRRWTISPGSVSTAGSMYPQDLNSPCSPNGKLKNNKKESDVSFVGVSSWPGPDPHFLGVHLGELRLRDLRVGRRRQVAHGQAVVAGVARVGRHEHEQDQQHHGGGQRGERGPRPARPPPQRGALVVHDVREAGLHQLTAHQALRAREDVQHVLDGARVRLHLVVVDRRREVGRAAVGAAAEVRARQPLQDLYYGREATRSTAIDRNS
jgi:hypothetical protein